MWSEFFLSISLTASRFIFWCAQCCILQSRCSKCLMLISSDLFLQRPNISELYLDFLSAKWSQTSQSLFCEYEGHRGWTSFLLAVWSAQGYFYTSPHCFLNKVWNIAPSPATPGGCCLLYVDSLRLFGPYHITFPIAQAKTGQAAVTDHWTGWCFLLVVIKTTFTGPHGHDTKPESS